jgi:hypothetical protein
MSITAEIRAYLDRDRDACRVHDRVAPEALQDRLAVVVGNGPLPGDRDGWVTL